METKIIPFELTSLDPTGRTVEGYANVFGVKDLGGDIVHPGAFAKTLAERGGAVRFLWQHNPNEPIGKPVEMREDAKGLYIKAVVSDTTRGRDALALLKDGAISGLSIGYDAMKGGTDYSKDAAGETVRNLREVKLWEFSLVTFPMNEAAGVTALKASYQGKPYNVVEEGGKWRVYKVDADGNPEGEPLGEHDSEASARRQVRAIYANEGGKAGRRMRADMRQTLATIRGELEKLSAWADYADMEDDEDTGEEQDPVTCPKATGPGRENHPPKTLLLEEIEFSIEQLKLLKE